MRLFLLLMVAACSLLIAGTAMAQPYHATGAYVSWGYPGDQPAMVDDGTNGDVSAGDGIYSQTVNVATAGAYEWRIYGGTDWGDTPYPGTGNNWFITTADNQDVLLTFDTNSAGDGWSPDSEYGHSDHTVGTSYTLVGSLGSELGGNDWDPTGSLLLVDDGTGSDDVAGDGIYTYCGTISDAGSYEWKIAVNGDWAQQFGADGAGINSATLFLDTLSPGEFRCFLLDLNRGKLLSQESPVGTEPTTWGTIKSLYGSDE